MHVCQVREARFSYETEPSVSITVAVTDSGEEPLTAEFPLLLHVLDANDPPNNLRINSNCHCFTLSWPGSPGRGFTCVGQRVTWAGFYMCRARGHLGWVLHG